MCCADGAGEDKGMLISEGVCVHVHAHMNVLLCKSYTTISVCSFTLYISYISPNRWCFTFHCLSLNQSLDEH